MLIKSPTYYCIPFNNIIINQITLFFIIITVVNIKMLHLVNGQQQQVTTITLCPPLQQTIKFSMANEYIIALECQVGPEYNQFKLTYSNYGLGASLYYLSESQYSAFNENVQLNAEYVPQKGDYLFYSHFPNSAFTSEKGEIISKPKSNFGKVRVLVKQNPDFLNEINGTDTSSVSLDLLITPQQDHTETAAIIVISIGGFIGLLCCVACCAGVIYYVIKRKAAYQEIF